MAVLLSNIEFFTYENEVWYRTSEGEMSRLLESSTAMVNEIFDFINRFYPKAFKALCDEYKGSSINSTYYRFLIASRFIRCNFAQLDNIPDFSTEGFASFEYVQCPMRGECRLECIVCRPEFDHKLSPAEMRVMRLWVEGKSENEIAGELFLSPCTVHNHIANAYKRTGMRSRSAFVNYAVKNNLFPNDK